MQIVEVRPDYRGKWGVALSEAGMQTRCETLADARRVAYARAAQRDCSELVIQDAYHRVIERRRFDAATRARDQRTAVRPTA
jgi:hypothetical protein